MMEGRWPETSRPGPHRSSWLAHGGRVERHSSAFCRAHRPAGGAHGKMPTNAFQLDHHARANWIDEVLADSFPASDPPSWTPGIATLSPSLPNAPSVAHTRTDMLHAGDLLPHFQVNDFYGTRIDYSSFWQRKNLVLVMLSDIDRPSRSYAEPLMPRGRESKEDD